MTERERACLIFLTDKMEATTPMIGFAIDGALSLGSHNYGALGAAVVRSLRKKGLTTFLPDLRAWRITPAGRAALGEGRES